MTWEEQVELDFEASYFDPYDKDNPIEVSGHISLRTAGEHPFWWEEDGAPLWLARILGIKIVGTE